MYTIGHIILGTYLPLDTDLQEKVAIEIVTANPDEYRYEDDPDADLVQEIKDGNMYLSDIFDKDPWNWEASDINEEVAWVGVKLKQFDDTEHVSLKDFLPPHPTEEQIGTARARYELLPGAVRDMLPPFGVYIVWSSS